MFNKIFISKTFLYLPPVKPGCNKLKISMDLPKSFEYNEPPTSKNILFLTFNKESQNL